jgi:hypothetical protein
VAPVGFPGSAAFSGASPAKAEHERLNRWARTCDALASAKESRERSLPKRLDGGTVVRNRQIDDPYGEMRERIIRETEQALTLALLNPERAVRIPTVVVGRAVFTPQYARAFWSTVLDMSALPKPRLLRWWYRRLRA